MKKVINKLRVVLIAIEVFLENAYKRPIWFLFFSLFGTSLVYLFSFYNSLPEDLAKAQRIGAKSEAIQNESEYWKALAVNVDECGNLLTRAFDSASALEKKLSSKTPIDKQEIIASYIILAEARNKLAKTLGEVRGSTFQSNSVSTVFKTVEEVFSTFEDTIPELEARFILYLGSKEEGDGAPSTKSSSEKIIKNAAEVNARVETLKRQLPTLEKEAAIEADEDLNKLKSILIKLIIALCAFLYLPVFLVFSVRGVQRRIPEALQRASPSSDGSNQFPSVKTQQPREQATQCQNQRRGRRRR